jgi:hypothetical protein
MLNFIRSSVIMVAAATVISIPNRNPIQAGGRICCCQTCRQPCGHCSCQAPAAPQMTYQPVVETQYAQQPVLQQRDVVATEFRNEAVLETVPATVVENVTVDEGSFQTVWVPRLTTRAVARTSYQTRTALRTVPYQVTRRVSEYATQSVPYQTVRYVPTNGAAIGSAAGPRGGGIRCTAGRHPTCRGRPPFRRTARPRSGAAAARARPDTRARSDPCP